MRRLFHGGIHPAGNKDLTGNGAPTPAPIPAEVVIPLRQHIGETCTPLVKVGDTVLLGQKIGDGGELCVPVHASVSGRVTAIENRPVTTGGEVLSVVIENDFLDLPVGTLKPHSDLSQLSLEEIISIIREAGIVGMGGVTYPTSIKAAVEDGRVEVLIANACECEPYITADNALLCTYPDQVLRGLGVLAKLLRSRRTILAVEDNKPDAIAAIRAQLAREQSGIELCILPTRYPQGAEKQLIYALTAMEISGGKLPKDTGYAVFNAATCASVYKAVYDGQPITRRIVSVTGEGIKNPKNYIVRIGTPFSALLETAGGVTCDPVSVIAGGPMMGIAQGDLSVPVTKGVNAVLVRRAKAEREETSCIRCGKCVEACPMKLLPLYLYRAAEKGERKKLEKFRLSDCIECGCCSYTCPAYLGLTEAFRRAKRRMEGGEA